MFTLATYAQNGSGGSFMDIIVWLASVAGLWKMLEKAGEPGWPALIPFYNVYKLCEVTMGNPMYWLRLFVFAIPVVGWIAGFYFMYQISKATALAYGKPEGYAWGYMFLSPIFYCLTGFGSDDYYGPMGVGDHRTSQARQAKTVNFDVVKNEPSQPQYQDYSQQTRVDAYAADKEEETVDFVFDQPEE